MTGGGGCPRPRRRCSGRGWPHHLRLGLAVARGEHVRKGAAGAGQARLARAEVRHRHHAGRVAGLDLPLHLGVDEPKRQPLRLRVRKELLPRHRLGQPAAALAQLLNLVGRGLAVPHAALGALLGHLGPQRRHGVGVVKAHEHLRAPPEHAAQHALDNGAQRRRPDGLGAEHGVAVDGGDVGARGVRGRVDNRRPKLGLARLGVEAPPHGAGGVCPQPRSGYAVWPRQRGAAGLAQSPAPPAPPWGGLQPPDWRATPAQRTC